MSMERPLLRDHLTCYYCRTRDAVAAPYNPRARANLPSCPACWNTQREIMAARLVVNPGCAIFGLCVLGAPAAWFFLDWRYALGAVVGGVVILGASMVLGRYLASIANS